jgi:hypothetical protein
MKLRSGLFILCLASASSTGLVVACSSSSSSGAGGDDAGTALDATGSHDTSTHDDSSDTTDAAPEADVQTPCGEAGTCTIDQLCVTFTTSGGSCDQTILEAGVCPAGYSSCGVNDDGGMFGCAVDSVSQQCTTLPNECAGTPSCATCGASLCMSCDCLGATPTTASCGCLAP